MSTHPKFDQVTIRLEPKLRRAVERAADADRRPVSNLVRNVLADWIAKRAEPRESAS